MLLCKDNVMDYCPDCKTPLIGKEGIPAVYCKQCDCWWTAEGEKIFKSWYQVTGEKFYMA